MKIKFNTCALLSVHVPRFSFHIGVYPESNEVYRQTKTGGEVLESYERWLWGRATEPYDHCLEYYGMGPFVLLCWPPSHVR